MRKPKPFRLLKVFGSLVPAFLVKGMTKAEGALGFYESENRFIGIDSSLRGDKLEATMVHELFHAMFHRLYLSQQIPPELEEVIIENLVVVLFDNYKVSPRK